MKIMRFNELKNSTYIEAADKLSSRGHHNRSAKMLKHMQCSKK